jgi:acyl-CoA reductase-like NAD-dependent aldehyde dehydrogenase
MILEDIPKDSPAYKDEIFGPVYGLYKANSDE